MPESWPELWPALPASAVAVLASGCVYALLWRATRGFDARARVLARAAPVAVSLPGLLWVSLVLSIQHKAAEARPADGARSAEALRSTRSAPRTPQQPTGGAAKAGDVAAGPGVLEGSNADWDIVPVFYGTDRRRTPEVGRVAYGADRARRLELGRALVTVPAAHRVPAIERPFALRIPYIQLVLYEQGEDPKKHFTIKSLEALSRNELLSMVRARIAAARAFRDQALVFIHGFNTGFDGAIFRAAQLAYDLQFDGAAFLYSWPAGAGVIGYARDRESATQAEPYLKEFLDLVIRGTGAKSVSVIAHSMGNLPLLNVLRELGPSLPPGVHLNEVILAAPDVDRDVFANLIGAIRGFGRGITLYCSANDRAMIVSRQVAGGVPRAGDVPPDGPVIAPDVDTIDVTETSTDLLALNHSLYAERSALLNDIALLLQTGERPPDKRIPILQRVRTLRGDFWRYP
jgi:esterase/lipase superfamily enzyme